MVISIIGGGAVGGYIGSRLEGDVHIYEEHRKIGEPVQCSGLLTGDIRGIVKIDKDVVLNEIGRVRLNSQCGNKCEFKLNKKDVVVDRAGFDKMLAGRAAEKGARLHMGCKVKGRNIKGDVIVGADGPFSNVARNFFQNPKMRFWTGMQARVEMKNEGDIFDVYLDVPGFFGWVIPENEEIARIGAGSERNTGIYFKKLMKKKGVKKILNVQAGVIPRYNPKTRVWNGKNAFLAGDSAGMVKALSGGGIIPGMRAAGILADLLNKKQGKLNSEEIGEVGNSYERSFKKEIGKNLGYSLKIREILEKFSNKDYDNLVYMLDKNGFKGFDRENIDFWSMAKTIRSNLLWFVLKKILS